MNEQTTTRFNNLKYEHFKVNFKGLNIEVKLLDNNAVFPNSEDKNAVEEFKVLITYKGKTMNFKFYNSQMEKGISDYLNELGYMAYNNKQFKSFVSSKFSWGGYDDVKNRTDLIHERIYNLLYSIINSFANDNNADLSSFSFFCDNFGYDNDSIKARTIYNQLQEQQEKFFNLGIDEKLKTYLFEIAGQEEKPFEEDVKKAIEQARTI